MILIILSSIINLSLLLWIILSKNGIFDKANRIYSKAVIDRKRLSYVIIDDYYLILLDNRLAVCNPPHRSPAYEITNLPRIYSINLRYETLEEIRRYGAGDLYALLTNKHSNEFYFTDLDVHIKRYPLYGNNIIDERELILKRLTKVMKP